jgi:ADP-ribose pyrophosphatase YjhB (NUDIX family)
LEKTKNFTGKKRTAIFKSVIVFYNPPAKEMYISCGETEGKILKQAIKNSTIGFGYNPIFFVNSAKKAYGEMTVAEKNGYSQRGKALIKIKYYLQNTFSDKEVVCPCALIVKNGKILLNMRNDPHRPDFHRKWEFPGGAVESGESIIQNLKREAFEESGWKIEPIKLLQTVAVEQQKFANLSLQVFLLPYLCKIVGGNGRFSDAECLESRWFDPDEALNYPMIGSNEKMYRKLLPELKKLIILYKF